MNYKDKKMLNIFSYLNPLIHIQYLLTKMYYIFYIYQSESPRQLPLNFIFKDLEQ